MKANRSEVLIARLSEENRNLLRENQRLKNSLALSVGTAIVNARTLTGAVQLPVALYRSFVRHHAKKKKRGRQSAPVARNDDARATAEKCVSLPSNSASAGIVGWPDRLEPGKPRILSVLDEFSRDCFAPHANLIEPRPDNWRELMERDRPQLILVESAWRGNGGAWQYRIGRYASAPGRELGELVAAARAVGVPTVFWNKEDPVHFDRFRDSASLFDVVLTSAREMCDAYRKLGVRAVDALPFAAEPSLHNPIGTAARNGRVCFAGSHYGEQFPQRRQELERLLDAANGSALDIFDRNHGSSDPALKFPSRFEKAIRGRLSYPQVCRAYREYSTFLNVNSVSDSATMFSRRVFELLACGTPVISSPSRGMEIMLGDAGVWVTRTAAEAKEAVDTLLHDPKEWRRRSLQGLRAVHSRHTMAHRLRDVLNLAQVDALDVAGDALVVVLAHVRNEEDAANIEADFARQEVHGAQLRLALIGPAQLAETARRATWVLDRRDPAVNDRINDLIFDTRPTHCGVWHGGAIYGRHYLGDLLNANRYSGAEIVGKTGDGRDHYAYGLALDEAAMLFEWRALARLPMRFTRFDCADLRQAVALGARSFASDGANFVRMTDLASGSPRESRRIELEL